MMAMKSAAVTVVWLAVQLAERKAAETALKKVGMTEFVSAGLMVAAKGVSTVERRVEM